MVGERLREARVARGLEIDDVAEATKLRASLIAAMEVDNFDACGGDVYARGHLRTVCALLGLDPEVIVGQYVDENPEVS